MIRKSKEGGGRDSSSPSESKVSKSESKDEAVATVVTASESGEASTATAVEGSPSTIQSSTLASATSTPTTIQQEAVAEIGERQEIEEGTRQVIAVSVSKGPAAFFNLARKFLATDEMCDLSALEGAIVSAVDAAHLLERSKLATIVRIQTSYVAVEPKRKATPTPTTAESFAATPVAHEPRRALTPSAVPSSTEAKKLPPTSEVTDQPRPGRLKKSRGSAAGELRRARIVITVKRTEEYKRWLEENPSQEIVEGDEEDDPEQVADVEPSMPPKR